MTLTSECEIKGEPASKTSSIKRHLIQYCPTHADTHVRPTALLGLLSTWTTKVFSKTIKCVYQHSGSYENLSLNEMQR